MEELIGKKLGQYEIQQKIEEGGMGVLFKAYQPSLSRYVAVKVLLPSLGSQDPNFIKRFEREARSIASLHHPNILTVYDFGRERDYSYIGMRYVEGEKTLRHVMHTLSYDKAIDLICQVAYALAYAHERGVIHRDVKPSNVLIDGDRPLLADFGLAKIRGTTTFTSTGVRMGTAKYMSPEQFRGKKELVDHRTDIYALGIILYEILTGVVPHYADEEVAIGVKRCTEPPPSPRDIRPDIPESVAQVVLRSLATKAEDRYDTALEFVTELKQAMEDVLPLTSPERAMNAMPPLTPLEDEETATLPHMSITTIRERIAHSLNEIKTTLTDPDKPLEERLSVIMSSRTNMLTTIGILITLISIIVSVRDLFSIGITDLTPSGVTPTQIVTIPVSPTFTSTPTLAPTIIPTDTPSPTTTPLPIPTSPIVMLPTLTITPTSTSMTVPDTPTATATPTQSLPTATATPSSSPTVSITESSPVPSGEFTLLKPISTDEPSYGRTEFEWQWSSTLLENQGFEVRIWRDDELPTGVHDAVLDNTEGRVEVLDHNTYRLVADISDTPGVQGKPGEYNWTVILVQIKPEYKDLGIQAPPSRLRFETGGDSGNGGGNGGGGAIIE